MQQIIMWHTFDVNKNIAMQKIPAENFANEIMQIT